MNGVGQCRGSRGQDTIPHFLEEQLFEPGRVLAEVTKGIGTEEVDEAELDRIEFWADQLEQRNIQADPEIVRANARTFRELERLVKALDTLETIASIVEISAEYVPPL